MVTKTRAGLPPHNAVEIRRVVLGFGAVVLAILAFGLSGRSGSPEQGVGPSRLKEIQKETDKAMVETQADPKEADKELDQFGREVDAETKEARAEVAKARDGAKGRDARTTGPASTAVPSAAPVPPLRSDNPSAHSPTPDAVQSEVAKSPLCYYGKSQELLRQASECAGKWEVVKSEAENEERRRDLLRRAFLLPEIANAQASIGDVRGTELSLERLR